MPELLSGLREQVRTPLYRSAYLLMAGAGINAILGYAYWIVAARLYDPHTVGVNSALITALLLASTLAQFSLTGVLTRYLPAAGEHANRLLLITYAISVGASLVIAPIVLLFYKRTAAPEQATLGFYALFALGVATWSIFAIQDGALVAVRKASWVATENAVYSVGKLALVAGLGFAAYRYGLIVSWIFPGTLMVIVITIMLHRLLQRVPPRITEPDPVSAGEVARYIGGNYPSNVLFQAIPFLVALLLMRTYDSTHVAFFYVCWNVYSALQLIPVNFTTSLTVEAVYDRHLLGAYCRQTLRHALGLASPAVVALVLVAPFVLRIFGSDYTAGDNLLRLLALSLIPSTVTQVAISALRVERKPAVIGLVSAAGFVASMAMCYVLIPPYGLTGAGIGLLVPQAIFASLLWVFYLSRVVRGSSSVR